MSEYRFDERLKMSCGHAQSSDVAAILMAEIPGALAVTKANGDNDRNGTDWWIEHCSGRHLSVDAKVREEDYAPRGKDDLAIETWSNVERGVIGWTRNETKRTDYVLWLWIDTKRWCLVPFAMLCRVTKELWSVWLSQHQTARQYTPTTHGGYHSECVFVPRRTVWAEIYKRFSGNVV